MRILVSGALPEDQFQCLLPFVRAAHDLGNDVLLTINEAMFRQYAEELLDIEICFVRADTTAQVLRSARQTRDGESPVPDVRNARIDSSSDDLEFAWSTVAGAASSFQPKLVLLHAEDFETLHLARGEGLPHAVVLSPGESPAFAGSDLTEDESNQPIAILDPTPSSLKASDRRAHDAAVPYRSYPYGFMKMLGENQPDRSRTQLLLASGRTNEAPGELNRVLEQLATLDVEVTVSTPTSSADLRLPKNVATISCGLPASLLTDMDLLIGAPGSSDVLAAATRGIPLIVIATSPDVPPLVAEAAKAGLAVVAAVEDVDEAVRTVLADGSYARTAKSLAVEIGSRPPIGDALLTVIARTFVAEIARSA